MRGWPVDILYLSLGVLAAPLWLRKSRGGWDERFGKVDPIGEKQRPRLLIHGVSVGEQAALRALVPLLAERCELVITATTDTGVARARELYGSVAEIRRYPLDFSWSVRRFLRAVAPDAAALVELEIWPQFIAECRARGIPVAVINGRLSAGSFRGYRRLRPVLRGTFASLDFAAVQDEDYAKRFRAMGVPDARCQVTGSMKWDTVSLREPGAPPAARAIALATDLGIDRARPLIVAGSTAPEETGPLHAACPPGVQLLVAPRKPEWFDGAWTELGKCVRRSGGGSNDQAGAKDRFLLDTIGELGAAYELADLVFVGRSLADYGGSDPIEPIALGRATLIGPHHSNFSQIVHDLSDRGSLTVVSRGELGLAVRDLLGSPGKRATMAASGQALIRSRWGASHRHAVLLLELLQDGRMKTHVPG